MTEPDRPGAWVAALTSRALLAGFALIAVLSWFYLARNDDWRGWVFAVPATLGVLAILALRRLTRPQPPHRSNQG